VKRIKLNKDQNKTPHFGLDPDSLPNIRA